MMPAWIVTITERYVVEAETPKEAINARDVGRFLDMECDAEEEYAYSARDTQQYYQERE